MSINDEDKLNENEWIYLEFILPFIEKISNVTKMIESDSNDIFFNALDLIMTILQDIPLEMINNGFTYQADLLKNALKKRLIKYQNYLLNLTIAAMLNLNLDSKLLLPDDFKILYLNAKNFIKSKIPHRSENENIKLSPRARKAIDNLNEFKLFKKVRLSKKVNVTNYWKENRHQFPNLFNIAKRYFCLRATSGNVERSFSMAKYALPDRVEH